MEGKELAFACARESAEIQAEDIQVLDVKGISSVTDYMVICTGNSIPHIRAVIRDIEKAIFQKYGVKPVYSEGTSETRWVVLDYIDVMIHIMHQEMREFYALEDFWKKENANVLDWQEGN